MNAAIRIVGLLSAIVAFAVNVEASTQPSLPTIAAKSKTIRILDGDDELVGEISPELNPDVYVYHPSAKPKIVSIITDISRLDIQVEPGKNYNFAIEYDGKLCNQQLSPILPNGTIYESKNSNATEDSIPFVLGPDNAIHFKGSINQSQELDLIFDTGASVSVLSDRGRNKAVRVVDGFNNLIDLPSMVIKNTPITYIDYKGKLRADGVVGYNAFVGKVVTIDYERGMLSVSDRTPALGPDYSKADLIWRGAGTFVSLELDYDSHVARTIALFDTGSRWSLSLKHDEKSGLTKFEDIDARGWRTGVTANGTRVSSRVFDLSSLTIAGLKLHQVQAEIEEPSPSSKLAFNILGNDFLKRFNTVIDYRESAVYLRVNRLANEPYNTVFNLRVIAIICGIIFCFLLAAFLYWKRKKQT